MAIEGETDKKLHRFAQETTVHGVSYALDKDAATSERCTWVFIIISAMTASLLLTANLWLGYIEGDLGTKNIPVNPRDRAFMEREFPMMYCPSNWINPVKVAALMKDYNMTFEGIAYALYLIPTELEPFLFLKDQLMLMKAEGMEYNETVADERYTTDYFASTDNRDNAVAEFSKLPHNSLWEFIEDVAVEYQFVQTIVRGKSMRYGHLCLELQANSAEPSTDVKVTSITYTVVHPQPFIVGYRIWARISPVVGDLQFSDEALQTLDRDVGFNDIVGETALPYTSLFNYDKQLSLTKEQLSIKAYSYVYSRDCEHTEFRGIHGAELPRVYCEQMCLNDEMRMHAMHAGCSMTGDWKSWKTGESNLFPCHLHSRWHENSHTSESMHLDDTCAKSCSINECTDYYRKIEKYGDMVKRTTPSDFWTALKEKINSGFWLENVGNIMWNFWFAYDYSEDYDYGDIWSFYYPNQFPNQWTWIAGWNLCVNMQGEQAIFQSENFPNDYPVKRICYYRFEAPVGRSVDVVVQTASLETNVDALVCFDGGVAEENRLGVLTGCTLDHDYCGYGGDRIYPDEQQWSAKSNVVLCLFYSDQLNTAAGFSVLLQSVDPAESGATPFWIDELRQPWSSGNFTFEHTIELNILQLQKAMEYEIVGWMDLLAGVGGVFSLFIGSSMLSIVHLFWFWCKNAVCKKKNKGDGFGGPEAAKAPAPAKAPAGNRRTTKA